MALTPDLDVRLYGADNKRMTLPSEWISALDFEVGERGGYGQGSMRVHEQYAGGFLPVEVERIDVRMWGQVLYRGFLRISHTDTGGEDQSASPSLYGMIELLNGYLVRRRFVYPVPVDPGVLFVDLVYEYVKRVGRQPNIVVDVAGVSFLSLLIQQFDAVGKSFSQAMNDLCDLFPQQLLWGCDVDGTGTDRIYLRPRVATVKYKFSLGDKVKALTYPRDATQIVNTLLITGASLDGSGYPPNLAPNGSFEDTLAPGEYTSNLLQNGDFDHGSGGTRPNNTWQVMGDPSLDGRFGRTGNAAVLDNNPSAEAIFEDVAVVGGQPCHGSIWAMVIAGETWRFRLILTYYDVSGAVLDTLTGDWQTPPADNVYRHYQLDWTNPAASGATKLRYRLETDPANSGAQGLNVDDASLWIAQVAAAKWTQGTSVNAHFTLLDWANSDNSLEPYDGGTMVKAQAAITGAGGYAEITNTLAARISVKPNRVYYVSAWVYAGAGVTITAAIGAKVYHGGTLDATLVGSSQTWTGGGWHLLSYIVTTGGNSDGVDILLRVYSGTVIYIDAVSVFENNLPNINHQEIYYPGSSYTAVRSVDDYAGFIGGAAAASITNWGPREQEVSNGNILTIADLDAFCILYFTAHAVSNVNAGLTIFGPTSPVFLDGQVLIVNMPSAPPSLFASNVRYRFDGAGVEMTIDLNDKQPDLALLLREIQEGKR